MADGQGAAPVGAELEGWHVVLRDGRIVYMGTRALCMRRRDEGEGRSPRSRWVVSYRVVAVAGMAR